MSIQLKLITLFGFVLGILSLYQPISPDTNPETNMCLKNMSNFCNKSTPGLSRIYMPQFNDKLKAQQFFYHYNGTSRFINYDMLKSSQAEINTYKVGKLVDFYIKNGYDISYGLPVVGYDYRIIDGHHRIAALKLALKNSKIVFHTKNRYNKTSEDQILVMVVNMVIEDIFKINIEKYISESEAHQ